MVTVAVLGSTGMLGSTMAKVFHENHMDIMEFNRSGISVIGRDNVQAFNFKKKNDLNKIFNCPKIDYVVNCIGVVNKLIDNFSQDSIENAYKINSEFPAALNEYSIKFGIPVIAIGTDCVFSGKVGGYSELDEFDPKDHYGKSKSLGENASSAAMIIRSSIIGRDKFDSSGILEWVLGHPINSVINGYVNHIWNGVTTLHFSQVISGVIQNSKFKKGSHHLLPSNLVSKFELLQIIAKVFDRPDLRIEQFKTKISVNRSLISTDRDRNVEFWYDAGYTEVPSVEEMLKLYSNWVKLR